MTQPGATQLGTTVGFGAGGEKVLEQAAAIETAATVRNAVRGRSLGRRITLRPFFRPSAESFADSAEIHVCELPPSTYTGSMTPSSANAPAEERVPYPSASRACASTNAIGANAISSTLMYGSSDKRLLGLVIPHQ